MNKYTFKEVRNGIPVFIDENGCEFISHKCAAHSGRNILACLTGDAPPFDVETIELGDTVTADIHEGKLINIRLVNQ